MRCNWDWASGLRTSWVLGLTFSIHQSDDRTVMLVGFIVLVGLIMFLGLVMLVGLAVRRFIHL